MANKLMRLLVVDDTVIYRKIIGDVLAGNPEIELVGTAVNGKVALQKIEQLRPDLITLDLEMPEMDGLAVLHALREQKSRVGVIMLSAFTTQGAEATLEALKLGAFDFVVKPSTDTMENSKEILRRELAQKIKAYTRARQVKDILAEKPSLAVAPVTKKLPTDSAAPDPVAQRRAALPRGLSRPEIVVLGISTGGPQSLIHMIPQLPADLGVPVLIVQHMPPLFTKSLADDLNRRCDWNVVEAQNNEKIQNDHIYIAPGAKQMKIDRRDDGSFIVITDDPPENNCKPAVDYLFRSAAFAYGANCLGVVMTGMGSDGTLGCRLLKRFGAQVIAQDQASCIVYGMPRQVIEDGLADVIAPLDQIAEQIARLAGRKLSLCR
jgi:two-component system, chemotaxis family, protein-glutamate methylesterase/glutaminase